jgi:hypothetical protein
MDADALQDLRSLALAGDDAALRVLNDAVMASGPLAESYLLGRHEETWESLRIWGLAFASRMSGHRRGASRGRRCVGSG